MYARAFRTGLLLVAVLLVLSGCGGGASSGIPSVPARVAAVDESGPPASAVVQTGGPPSSTLAVDSGPSTRVQSSAIAPRTATQQAPVAQFSSDRWVMAGLGKGAAGWAEFFAVDLTSSSRNPDGSPSCLIASNDAWARIPSSAYQTAVSAPTHTCCGDLDGDGRDELAIGTGDAGRGTVYVYRPTSSGFVSLASVSLTDFPAYTDSAQAPSFPACVDIDGDGRAELVVGTGPAGQGFAQIFRYDAPTRTFSPLSGTPYAHGYVRVAWTGYTGSGNAPVYPAGGWLKGRGTGKTQQLVLGLGPTGQGWVQLWTWDGSALAPWTAGGSGWLQVAWPAYNASGDAPTWPAVGDVDGDGIDDLVVGLGDRGAGWLQIFRSSGAALASHRWVQVEWSSYAASGRAPTHPAVGDIDGDGKADVVVGLGDGGNGWMWAMRGTAKSWSQVQWGAYTSSATAPTWPSVGRGAIPAVTALQITPTMSSMPLGASQAFVATATLSDGSTVDASQTVTWSTSNAAILTVAAGGAATAVTTGAATVTAKLGAKTASQALTVTPAALESIAVSPNPGSIFTECTRAFTATGIYTDGSRVDVTRQATWASDAAAVAFRGAAGVGSGVSAGSANVSASLNGITGTAACTVVDPRLVSIAVSGDATTLPLGVRQPMNATGAFDDGTFRDVTSLVTWSSSDATRVSVSASGEATAVALGTASVRATFGQVVGSLDITATAAALTSIQVSPLAPSLAKGLAQQLTATGVYTDGTQADLTNQVTWQSSDASVTVSNASGSRGLATASSKGSSTVTATLGGKSGQATVTVTDAVIQSLEVSPTTADVPLCLTQALVATAVYTDGSRLVVTTDATWSSADATSVAVSNGGVVTSLKTGTVTITVSLEGKQATANVTASPAVLQQVQVTPPSASLAKGLEQPYQATGLYSDASTHDLTHTVTWSTTDGAVASISNASGSAGLLRGLATGGVTVTATLDGKTGTASLTVTPAEVTSVVVSPATVSLPQGVDRQLTATAYFSDGTASDVSGQATWTTDDQAVAICSTTDPTRGVLHAVAAGSTTAKATLSGKTGSATVTVTTPALQRIDVTAQATMLPKGVQLQCTATGVYDNGTHTDLTSQSMWTSTDLAVATVSTTGLVTGAGTGPGTIKASFDGVDGTLDITGTAAALVSIQVSPLAPSLAKGLTQQFTATGVYTDETQADLSEQVTWQSSDASVTVSNANGSRGLATAASKGSATVSAMLGGKSGQATVTVTDAVIQSVEVSPTTVDVPLGLTEALVATAVYTDGTRLTVTTDATWSSAQAATVAVSSAGVVTSLKTGTVTITATLNGKQATATVTASAEILQQVQVTPSSASLAKGLEQQFRATGVYSDTSTHDLTDSVTWSTSDGALASISNAADSAGLLRGLATGGVTVTAVLSGKSGTASLTVTPAVVTSVVVSPATVSLPQGVDRQLAATAYLSDGTTSDVTSQATWTTDDETIAICSTTDPTRGLLHVVAAGSTTAKATLSGKTGSAAVTVTTPVLQRIDVTAPSTTLPKGVQSQCTATGVYDNGTHADLTSQATWTTIDSGLISVTTGGLVTAAGTGTASIKASFGGVDGTLDFTGTAAILTSIAVTPADATVPKGQAQAFEAWGTFSDGSRVDLTDTVTWSSSVPAVATVGNATGVRGQASTLSQGQTEITATHTATGASASVLLTVTASVVTSLRVVPGSLSLAVGQRQTLLAQTTYSDGTHKDVTSSAVWSTSDGATVGVSAGGVVSALAVGQATVTASAAGMSGTTTATISLPVAPSGYVDALISTQSASFGQPYFPIDLNGDGRLDVIAQDQGNLRMFAALGRGDGTFPQAVTHYSTPSMASGGYGVGDVTGDGKVDIVVSGTSAAYILPGRGDGTFGAYQAVAVPGATSPLPPALLDANGDGALDVAIPDRSKRLFLCLGNGDGTFGAPSTFALPGTCYHLAIGDVDGDGNADIVVAPYEQGGVYVMHSDGHGLIGPPNALEGFDTSIHYAGLADMNGDGRLDVVGWRTAVQIALNNGDGTFRSAVTVAVLDCFSAAFGDLDGDGRTDMVAGMDGIFHVLYGNGDGTVQPAEGYGTAANWGIEPALGDFDGDGRLDVVFTAGISGVETVLNLGNRLLSAPLGFTIGNLNPTDPTIRDVNLDGIPDIVVAGKGQLWVQAGRGDGTYDATVTSVVSPTLPNACLALPDLDGDGVPDAVVGAYKQTVQGIQGTPQIVTLRGKGDGTFTSAGTYTFSQVAIVTRVVSADFNSDGRPDVAAVYVRASTSPYGQLVVLAGNGDGTLAAPVVVASVDAADLATADVDNDGHADLAILSGTTSGPFTVYRGRGDGTFQSPQITASAGNAPLCLADVDENGKIDAITGTTVLLGNGDGTFGAALAIGVQGKVRGIGDVNLDGHLDVMASTSTNQCILALYIGNGTGSFHESADLLVAEPGLSVFAVPRVGGPTPDIVQVGSAGAVRVFKHR